jgi:uncharacterized protein YecT (DUF1311 family)
LHKPLAAENSMTLARAALMVMIVLSTLPAWSVAAEGIRCNPSGGQSELNACAADDLADADRKLNDVYRAIQKQEAGNPVVVQKLRAVQRAWMAFRDAELDLRFACENEDPRFCFGSMFPMEYMSYKADLTRERTRRLQQLLDEGQKAN